MLKAVLLLYACLSTFAVGIKGPVIIDTDIGADIDDSYVVALSVALKWDIKLIITDTWDTVAKAQVLAKYLTIYNRTDVPMGIGIQITNKCHDALYPWAKNFSLASYKGVLYRDGFKRMVEILQESPEPVTIIAIAPPVNLAVLADRYPKLVATKVKHVYAMFGSIGQCYGWKAGQCREANAATNVTASNTFLRAPWPVSIAPLDVAQVVLNGTQWQRLRAANNSQHIMVQTILYTWCFMHPDGSCPYDSDFLYDPTDWFLSFNKDAFGIKQFHLTVNKTGFTNPTTNKRDPLINVALTWKPHHEQPFKKLIADALLSFKP